MSSTLKKTQKNFDAHKISCKAKFSIIDKNEISILKNKINSLSNVLKVCEFDKVRLEAMFFKRQTQIKSHTSHVSHAHTQHHAHHATHTSHFHARHAHHNTHTHTPNSQHIHTHHARHTTHTHTKHVHTPHSHHAFIYGRVYSCTYCDRKGYLAKKKF